MSERDYSSKMEFISARAKETNEMLTSLAFEKSNKIIERKIKELREKTPNLPFKKTELAEVEINKFFL